MTDKDEAKVVTATDPEDSEGSLDDRIQELVIMVSFLLVEEAGLDEEEAEHDAWNLIEKAMRLGEEREGLRLQTKDGS